MEAQGNDSHREKSRSPILMQPERRKLVHSLNRQEEPKTGKDYSTPETERKESLSLRMLMAALVETKQRRIGVVNGISVHRGRRNLEGRNKLEMRKKGTETCCKMTLSYKFYNPIFIKKNI